MDTFRDRFWLAYISALTLTLLASSAMVPASAAGWVEDASLTGGLYYWQRERYRKDVRADDKYRVNLSHATWNANLDYQSGLAWGWVGLDVALFTALEMAENSHSSHPNEIAFSSSNKAYRERYRGDKSDISLYKAAVKFASGPFWARVGYIQPTGQTLLAPHWSFMPGTYQGAESGANFDYGDKGALSFSYLWVNRYKSPWHTQTDKFYRADRQTSVNYLHSAGLRYDFKNDLVAEIAVGQAQNFVDQFFAKSSYQFSLAGQPLSASYQFYGARDRADDGGINDIYDGLAWLQGITLGYRAGALDLRLEGTYVRAPGQQGFFLQRMTPAYASSNGRLDIWWDNRSDFNAHGEKALFFGAMYDLTPWDLPGWALGGSVVYAWDARPATWVLNDRGQPQSRPGNRIEESAFSLDAMYTVQKGKLEGTLFKLHFTRYDNHSSIPDWGGGYGNMFQDERDVKFIVIAPFTVF